MSPTPPPSPSYLDTLSRVRRKGVTRWKNQAGDRLYEWDWTHGHIEGYDKRGYHVGVFDAVTGVRIGKAVKGRRIDV